MDDFFCSQIIDAKSCAWERPLFALVFSDIHVLKSLMRF